MIILGRDKLKWVFFCDLPIDADFIELRGGALYTKSTENSALSPKGITLPGSFFSRVAWVNEELCVIPHEEYVKK